MPHLMSGIDRRIPLLLAVRRLVKAGRICMLGEGPLPWVGCMRREWRGIEGLRVHRCVGATTVLHGHDALPAALPGVGVFGNVLPLMMGESDQLIEVLRCLGNRSLPFARLLQVSRGNRLDLARWLALLS